MEIEAIACQEAIQDAEDQDQNGGFSEESGDAMGGDLHELLKDLSAVRSEGGVIERGGNIGRNEDQTGG
jgi:hypothetical protein